MDRIWARIHAWLGANAPAGYGRLHGGASESEIRAAEKALGLELPEDIKASYRIHDGQEDEPGLLGGEGWRLFSLREIVDLWGRWSRYPEMAHRVPLADIVTGDHVFLSVDPKTGRPDRLLIQRHDRTSPDPFMPSFAAWLADFAGQLEAGELVYAEEEGCLMYEDEIGID
jgi:cell wall assembly regulator SMI1